MHPYAPREGVACRLSHPADLKLEADVPAGIWNLTKSYGTGQEACVLTITTSEHLFRVSQFFVGPAATRLAGFSLKGTMTCETPIRSEEHTSEPQSLLRISYAVFCLQKKSKHPHTTDL